MQPAYGSRASSFSVSSNTPHDSHGFQKLVVSSSSGHNLFLGSSSSSDMAAQLQKESENDPSVKAALVSIANNKDMSEEMKIQELKSLMRKISESNAMVLIPDRSK